jgi:hypothetical protein
VAYACKLLSGVALAAEIGRPAGKGAIASLAFSVLGRDFPFRATRTVLVALLLALGGLLLALVWQGSPRAGSAPRGDENARGGPGIP